MKIFISYSHQDKPKVNEIAKQLEKSNYTVWIDSVKLKAGDNISQKISAGINSADAILVVISSNSLNSKWVLQEFASIAFNELSKNKVRIIPVLLDDSSIPSYLSDYFYLDFSTDFYMGLDKLISTLDLIKSNNDAKEIISNENNSDSMSNQISTLGRALKQGRLTLVCGAGISVGAGIPVWGELLYILLGTMFKRISQNHSLNLDSDIAKEFSYKHGTSSLILGKYLKNNLGNDFNKQVRNALYSTNPKTCELINAIVDLSRPQRDGKALDSIITFNFDDLIEFNLSSESISNKAIYTEAVKHAPNELPVYHVHGYLPRKGTIHKDTNIVFSEDAYHSQFIEPYSWSNLIQLNKLTQNTCLFVGISLTDPNLRRLLDVAWRKDADNNCTHYIIKKRTRHSNEVYNHLIRLLEEQDANALGINVIWVDDFNEIPNIIRSIKTSE